MRLLARVDAVFALHLGAFTDDPVDRVGLLVVIVGEGGDVGLDGHRQPGGESDVAVARQDRLAPHDDQVVVSGDALARSMSQASCSRRTGSTPTIAAESASPFFRVEDTGEG